MALGVGENSPGGQYTIPKKCAEMACQNAQEVESPSSERGIGQA